MLLRTGLAVVIFITAVASGSRSSSDDGSPAGQAPYTNDFRSSQWPWNTPFSSFIPEDTAFNEAFEILLKILTWGIQLREEKKSGRSGIGRTGVRLPPTTGRALRATPTMLGEREIPSLGPSHDAEIPWGPPRHSSTASPYLPSSELYSGNKLKILSSSRQCGRGKPVSQWVWPLDWPHPLWAWCRCNTSPPPKENLCTG